MKKNVSVIIGMLMLVAALGFSGCTGKQQDPAAAFLGGGERFILTADKTSVAPGDTVTVTLRAENCKNVACFDVLISASEALAETAAAEKDEGGFITTVSELPDGVQFSAIIATTGNIEGLDMLTVTYTVSEDAKPGDSLSVEGAFSQYLVGTDESGDQTADATNLISVEPLTLTVA